MRLKIWPEPLSLKPSVKPVVSQCAPTTMILSSAVLYLAPGYRPIRLRPSAMVSPGSQNYVDNQEWLISRLLRFLSDQLTDLLSELWRTEDLSASEKAQGPQPSHDEATWEQNISHICSPISLKGFGWVDWNQSFNWILRLCLPTLLVRVMFLWLCLGRVNPLRRRSFSWDLIQFIQFILIYLFNNHLFNS